MSERAWDVLREMAGPVATIDQPGPTPYATTHEDGWSRDHLWHVAQRRLYRAYWAADPAPGVLTQEERDHD